MNEMLMICADTRVTCPKCEHEFSLEQGFAKQALESLSSASQQSLAALREQERVAVRKQAGQLADERAQAAQRQIEEMRQLLKQQGETHVKSLAEVRALTEQSLTPQLEALKRQLEDSQGRLRTMDEREAAMVTREHDMEARVQQVAAIRAAELLDGERQFYEKRIADTQGQLQTLRAEQLALREERQQLQDEKAALALAVRRQVDDKLKQLEDSVRAQEQERAAFDKAELQKKLDDVSGQLTDAQRKMSQGSQQLQGEVLELAIEQRLSREFPLDSIEEVKKGVRGGDVIQRVVTRVGQPAGIILWETKRARDWSAQWIAKLKEDMRSCGAEIGVLVTMPTATPKEWESGQLFALHEEVWVSVWAPALQLAAVLRAALIDVHKQRVASAGKGEHMEAVYDYLTSPQFAHKLKAVYGAFQKMRAELESEKNTTMQRWARREKQLQTGVAELLGVAGDIQGLAQQQLPALEMEPDDEPAADDN
jgi:hypothetical protein